MSKDLVVTMNVKQLDTLIYNNVRKASRRSNDELFNGLANFLYKYNEQFEQVFEELEFIKSYLKMLNIEVPENPEIDYKKIAAEVSNEMKDAFGAVIENINENTNEQVAKVMGE